MHVIAWNIWHGGGRRSSAIADELVRRNADVFVLGEYQRGRTEPLIALLGAAGWEHVSLTDPPGKYGGLAIVSKIPLEPRAVTSDFGTEEFRYQTVVLRGTDLEICGVYGPLTNDPYQAFWDAMVEDLRVASERPVLVVGDFNSGARGVDSPAPTLFCSQNFARLGSCGYVDLWRQVHGAEAREYTWKGRAHPYRLDHAFGSPVVARRVRGCSYDHSVRERGLSDHSLLSIELT